MVPRDVSKFSAKRLLIMSVKCNIFDLLDFAREKWVLSGRKVGDEFETGPEFYGTSMI
jgi:hypothetical protein